MICPFELERSDLLRISSGVVANPEAHKYMKTAKRVGEEALNVLIQIRFMSQSADFYSPPGGEQNQTVVYSDEKSKSVSLSVGTNCH